MGVILLEEQGHPTTSPPCLGQLLFLHDTTSFASASARFIVHFDNYRHHQCQRIFLSENKILKVFSFRKFFSKVSLQTVSI